MNNFKKISKGAILGIILLSIFIYFSPPVEAVSADKGNFVILGREGQDAKGNKQIVDEKISLCVNPGANDVVRAKMKSGIVVLVLDKTTVQGKKFYIVSTVGKDGGMMGWVSEDYIYNITTEPARE